MEERCLSVNFNEGWYEAESQAEDYGRGEVLGLQKSGVNLRFVTVQGEDVCLRWLSGQGSVAVLTPVFTLPQSYIQSFRDRQTGSSLSSFMASPTDTDYEYGSRGPLAACSGPPVRV